MFDVLVKKYKPKTGHVVLDVDLLNIPLDKVYGMIFTIEQLEEYTKEFY
jgi:hypothetical protein